MLPSCLLPVSGAAGATVQSRRREQLPQPQGLLGREPDSRHVSQRHVHRAARAHGVHNAESAIASKQPTTSDVR